MSATSLKTVRLSTPGRTVFKMPLSIAENVPDGTYSLMIFGNTNSSPAAPIPLTIIEPVSGLSATAQAGAAYTIGKKAIVPVTIRNDGPAKVADRVNVAIFMSPQTTPLQFAQYSPASIRHHISLLPGASTIVRMHTRIDATPAPETYFWITTLTPTSGFSTHAVQAASSPFQLDSPLGPPPSLCRHNLMSAWRP